MGILVDYLGKIFKRWVIYVGLIPAIYDLSNAYLHLEFEFPKYMIIGFPILVFLIAIYQVYKEEHLLRISLEEKLAGPTAYEVTIRLIPIDFQELKIMQQVDNIKSEAKNKLDTAPLFMRETELDKYNHMMKALSSMSLYEKTPTDYNNELSK